MILRALIVIAIFIVVFLLLWKVLSRFIPKRVEAPKIPDAPLPASVNELKVLKQELEDKLELLSNKKDIEDYKRRINEVNAKLAEYA
jgi:hypothetical protein